MKSIAELGESAPIVEADKGVFDIPFSKEAQLEYDHEIDHFTQTLKLGAMSEARVNHHLEVTRSDVRKEAALLRACSVTATIGLSLGCMLLGVAASDSMARMDHAGLVDFSLFLIAVGLIFAFVKLLHR